MLMQRIKVKDEEKFKETYDFIKSREFDHLCEDIEKGKFII